MVRDEIATFLVDMEGICNVLACELEVGSVRDDG